MAKKNTVTLTFAGDSESLEKSFDKIGSGAKEMGRSVDKEGDRLERLGETGGTTETRFLGLGAAISGTSTLLSGDAGPEDYAMAMADMGDAVEHTIAPLLAQGKQLVLNGAKAIASAAQHAAAAATTVAGWIAMGFQATVNAVKMAAAWLISLGPVALVIAAVGAVIAILVKMGFGFDDIKRIAGKVWDFILGAIKSVFNWLKSNWPLVLAIITGPIGLAVLVIIKKWDAIKAGFRALKDWIARTASGMWNGLTSGLVSVANWVLGKIEAMLNGIIRLYNNTVGRLPGAPDIGAVSLPRLGSAGPGAKGPRYDRPIKRLAAGGIVTRPTFAMVGESGPEAVIPLGKGGGMGMTVNIYVQGSINGVKDIEKIMKDAFARGAFR